MNKQFLADVAAGLGSSPKFLSSKYFYDKKGDQLFMQIMDLPEYYLTRAEMDIFTSQTGDIVNLLGVQKGVPFDVIELGAGDGSKTKMLLAELLGERFDFDYVPVDISANVLAHLERVLSLELPDLRIKSQNRDYFQTLQYLNKAGKQKIVLYLGSNLGNMPDEAAREFIYALGKNLNEGDKLILGVDLIKPSNVVLPAYSDSQGITSLFNLNLLHRINRELNANFKLDQFSHIAEYDEEIGIAKSYLKSEKDQDVYIGALKKTFIFAKDEKIQTEISRKYDQVIIGNILSGTGFTIKGVLKDKNSYFADYILELH
ncbi:L-histidine N(alpha)-methyltransferase [Hellea balneolensis]|uniref:L-histidine N(alpha)-methyltransferase n=1 Tax=Hellea balneolensis TaxID=287478 RepID=UPI00040F86DF|nr:L-histidine N(alpha)-methyltransferase [Hellea balneolensis]